MILSGLCNTNKMQGRIDEFRAEAAEELQLAALVTAKKTPGFAFRDKDFVSLNTLMLRAPSAKSQRKFQIQDQADKQEYQDRVKAEYLTCKHLKADSNKKVGSHMKIGSGKDQRWMTDFLTIFNENGVPVVAINTQGDSYDRPEIQAAVEDLQSALRVQGKEGPALVTVDNKF